MPKKHALGSLIDRFITEKPTRFYGARCGVPSTPETGTRARYTVAFNDVPRYVLLCGPDNEFFAEVEVDDIILNPGVDVAIYGELISGPNKLSACLVYEGDGNKSDFPVL